MVSVKLCYLRKYINFDILYWLSFKKCYTLLFSLLLLWQSIWDNLKEEKLCFRSQFRKLLVWWWLESTSLGLRWGKGSHSHIRWSKFDHQWLWGSSKGNAERLGAKHILLTCPVQSSNCPSQHPLPPSRPPGGNQCFSTCDLERHVGFKS